MVESPIRVRQPSDKISMEHVTKKRNFETV